MPKFIQHRSLGARKRRSPLFEIPAPDRNILVVVDVDTWTGNAEQRELLEGLLANQNVDLLRFSDAGPPAEAERIDLPWLSVTSGWLEVTEIENDFGTHTVRFGLNGSVTEGAILGDVGRGDRVTSDTTYKDMDVDAAAARRRSDSVALGAALAAGADLLVTERPFLLRGNWTFAREMNICDFGSALGYLGLYLRSRGVFLGWASSQPGATFGFGKSDYFWTASRALLPEGWRWFSACVHADDDQSDMTLLAQSAFQRLGRALQCRDALAVEASFPPTRAGAFDLMYHFDSILISLVGVFDVLARVAHRAISLTDSERNAGWTRKVWRTSLLNAEPSFQELMGAGAEGLDFVTVLGLLRNTVHGAGLQAVTRSTLAPMRDETVVALPTSDAQKLVEILQARNWDTHWGLDEFAPGRLYVDPYKVIEQMVAFSVPLLNQLMAATPVERLTSASAARLAAPTDDGPWDQFGPRIARSLRWQLSL